MTAYRATITLWITPTLLVIIIASTATVYGFYVHVINVTVLGFVFTARRNAMRY